MEALLLGGKVVTLVGTVGTDILFSTAKTITTSLIGGIKYITALDQPGLQHVKKDIKRIDIESKILVLESFIEELKKKKKWKDVLKLHFLK